MLCVWFLLVEWKVIEIQPIDIQSTLYVSWNFWKSSLYIEDYEAKIVPKFIQDII